MIQDLWRQFPRHLVRNIEELLDEAGPNALTSLQIYRRLRSHGLTESDVPQFSKQMESFYARPRTERRKSQFDTYLSRPMNDEIFELFDLDFRTAAVSEASIERVASWAHHLIRVAKKTSAAFASLDVLTTTVRRLTNPGRNEKARALTFEDFSFAWKRTVTRRYGPVFELDFAVILKELKALDEELQQESRAIREPSVETSLVPGVYLSQSQIAWTIAVREAVEKNLALPPKPLENSFESTHMRDLNRACRLYAASRDSRLPEIIRQRDNIRVTVLDRCARLLGEERKLAS